MTDTALSTKYPVQVAAAVAAELAQIPMRTNLNVAVIVEINDNAENLLQQAERANVSDKKSLGAAGDLVKIARANKAQAEKMRKEIVAPANAFVKQANAMFKAPVLVLDQAKTKLEEKMSSFLREAQAEARRAAEHERNRIADQALAAAAASAEANDDASAEVILETAAAAVDDVTAEKSKVYGDFGATTSTRRVVSGNVTDMAEFLIWAGTALKNGGLEVPIDKLIQLRSGGLNTVARHLDELEMPDAIPGFEVRVETKANVR